MRIPPPFPGWVVALRFGDAVEASLPAQKQLAANDGDRGAEAVVEPVDCQYLGYVSVTHHERCPLAIGDVKAVGGAHR